ncbi:MAG TPA: hypothetical protein VFI23_07680 [Rhizomicrobium sp.]|nr:hypothetical protein [Rhizomicrobium sp.]
MTLLIALVLIYHAGLSWWWYPAAVLLWAVENLIRYISRQAL